jgi:hypothetical protein
MTNTTITIIKTENQNNHHQMMKTKITNLVIMMMIHMKTNFKKSMAHQSIIINNKKIYQNIRLSHNLNIFKIFKQT